MIKIKHQKNCKIALRDGWVGALVVVVVKKWSSFSILTKIWVKDPSYLQLVRKPLHGQRSLLSPVDQNPSPKFTVMEAIL